MRSTRRRQAVRQPEQLTPATVRALRLATFLSLAIFLFASARASAQDRIGQLRLTVTDSGGAGLSANCVLSNEANRFRLSFQTSPEGQYTVTRLPFGRYQLAVERAGFAAAAQPVVIRSETAVTLIVQLTVAARAESITVVGDDTLLDTINPEPVYEVGKSALLEQVPAPPGRSLIDVVEAQPGWLLEANGVLHPRGAEYETQYVADGVPLLDNRSPAFSAGHALDDVQSVRVFTSGIPAEYGRKLGGIVETVSDGNPLRGWHGGTTLAGGSFRTGIGDIAAGYAAGRNAFRIGGHAAHTGRFLDAPVPHNYTNSGDTAGFSGSFETDITAKDRLRLQVDHDVARMLVPNDYLQQAAGQRQHRMNGETAGQVSYQHTFSPSLLGVTQLRVRDLSAGLRSNAFSVPIAPLQQRGFREGYLTGHIELLRPHHEVKIGGDVLYSSVHELFSYLITSPQIAGHDVFDPSTPVSFFFRGAALDREQSGYAQDRISAGNFSLSAGIRYDHYKFRVDESAWSPRLAAAWYLPKPRLVLRASYDRVFGTPASENLLLSTSASLRNLNASVAQLPLHPSRGNYYEVGATKELARNLRWSLNYYRRELRNVADDDTLLNTGVSFPIALHSASIYGVESQLVLATTGPFSGWLNYSYMVAGAQLPAVGGLFLGRDDAELLNSTERIWASQDQRHTAHGQLRFQPASRFWTAVGASYGSGLPVELANEDPLVLAAEVGQMVLSRVDLQRGRVMPFFALDLSAGAQLWKRETRALQLQGYIQNLTDRLNVINIANLFSGTALASPRAFSARLRFEF